MVKRFCDTEIWQKDWFIELDDKHKLLTKFIFDACDCAGIYKISWKMLNFLFTTPVTLDDFKKIKQVVILDNNTIFIEDFVLFQCGISSLKELNPNNNAHKGIIKRLKEIMPLTSPTSGAKEGLTSPLVAPQEKEKEKEKDNTLSSFASFLLSTSPEEKNEFKTLKKNLSSDERLKIIDKCYEKIKKTGGINSE